LAHPTVVSAALFVIQRHPAKRATFQRVGVARLVVRLLGILIILCRRLTLLASFLTTAVLLTRPLIRVVGAT